MMQYNLDALADGMLRDQAIAAINDLVRGGLPASRDFGRTQMKHLQLIARDEPEQVASFAKHQWDKLPKDNDQQPRNQVVAAVWTKVGACCHRLPNDEGWSIERAAHAFYDPAWLALETPLPQGAAVEDRQVRNRLKAERTAFTGNWTRDVTPIFFDFFCVEYLFQIN